jgi:prepilin-type N-terminal cleavage/methylation domain-containing protein
VRKHPKREERGDEGGFTLLEVVIVLVVMTIIVGGITAAFITSFRDSTGVQARLSNSTNAQLTSAFFVRDVESASTVSTSATPLCAPAGFAVSATQYQVIGLEWLQGAVETGVSYVTTTTPPALVRYTCKGSTTPVSKVNVSSGVSSANLPTVSVSCYSSVHTCAANAAGLWPSGGVSNITLNMNVNEAQPNQPPAPYQYALAASPRTIANGSGGGPTAPPPGGGGPIPPLLLLGTGPNILNLELGGLTINVNGTIDLNSSASSSVNVNGIFNTVNATAFNIYNCASSAGASCTNGAVNIGGFFDSVNPSPVSMASTVSDPLQNLLVPPGPSAVSDGCKIGGTGPNIAPNISASNQPITCQPGLYPSGLTISGNNNTVTFVAGTYQFGASGCSGATCGLTITGTGNTLTFGAGVYGFLGNDSQNNCLNDLFNKNNPQGGLNIVGSSNTLNSGVGGVFFYVAGGQTNFGCGVVNSVNLAPPTTGPYSNILLWQDKSDSLPVVMTGFGNSANLYGGTVYAPSAQMQLIGGGETFTTGSVVASSVEVLGILNCVTIGSTTSKC